MYIHWALNTNWEKSLALSKLVLFLIFVIPCVSGDTTQLTDSGNKYQINLTSKNHWDSVESLDLLVDDLDPDMFVAKHDFAPIGPGQLALKKGDEMYVKEYNNDGDWCEVETTSGAIGWVPAGYIVKLDSLRIHSWYHGLVTRQEAEHRLRSGVNGSFLIRKSKSRAGQYSLSLKHNGCAKHYKICTSDSKDHYFIYPEAKLTTLPLLVYHHSNHPDGLITTLRYPAVNPTKQLISTIFHEVDKWEVERSDLVIGIKLGTGQYREMYQAVLNPKEKIVAVKTFKVFS